MSRYRKDIDKKQKDRFKHRCFVRDGWCENVKGKGPTWFAHCAFGCGIILWMETATLDHYPIPYRISGTWELPNLRLACSHCNSLDGAAYDMSKHMPKELIWEEKVEWFREREKYLDKLTGPNGIPLRNL